jgi:DNA helicase IV
MEYRVSDSSDLSRADEIKLEQAFFDHAWECREWMREMDRRSIEAAASVRDAVAARRAAERAGDLLRGSGEEVAFAAVDTSGDERWYIGYASIFDHDHDAIVSNWKAPISRPFFEATVDDPHGLMRRRRFATEVNTVIDFDDLVFAELAAAVQQLGAGAELPLEDALLNDLARARTGEMEDIVRTIQASQYKLMRAPLDQVLVVQGGPGTGKTAVALHRVSWLLFNHRDTLTPADVLVVGPNPTFTRYIRSVLPTLGDEDVLELDIASVGVVRVNATGAEAPAVAKLKGSEAMHRLLELALRQRIKLPAVDLAIAVGARNARVKAEAVKGKIVEFSKLNYASGRSALRGWLMEEVQQQTQAQPSQFRDGLNRAIDGLWPQTTARSFVRDLYHSLPRLIQAAGSDLTAEQVESLRRDRAERESDEAWSVADVAVLDAADALISDSVVRQFRHIVVDEAQDLSPMQLRMLARRSSTGSMTLVGDIAQSTGLWARDSWDEITRHLPARLPIVIEELEIGYRVPAEVFALAAQLLPHAAPEVTPPRVVRHGAEPRLLRCAVGDRADMVVAEATANAGRGHSVGIISPVLAYDEVRAVLDSEGVAWADASKGVIGSSINLIRPVDAKGLELDAIVVVEPAAIVEEVERGLRMLYVALTRTTKYLSVVHTRGVLPIPGEEEGGFEDDQQPDVPPAMVASGPAEERLGPAPVAAVSMTSSRPRLVEQTLRTAAEEIAGSIREAIPPHLWAEVLERVRLALEGPMEEGENDNG